MKRNQEPFIQNDLKKKMIFLVGPRQTGKTWLAKNLLSSKSVYLNYDRLQDRKIIESESWLEDKTNLLVLDELHKMPQWKNYLKGIYDTKPAHLSILVTGSARLDLFKQTGDSLAGRYLTHHLFPLSLKELLDSPFEGDIERLMNRGGFPEPFLAENDFEVDRWRNQYIDSLVREDILDYETIENLKSIRLILELLQQRVGSPISYQSISRDVALSPVTVKKYIHILEALYIIFKVTPYSQNIARSLLKEPKIYFFDTGLVVKDEGKRFENLIALHLLKHVQTQNDIKGTQKSLHYLRTKEQLEVDFCITDKKGPELIPELMIEAKTADDSLHKSLKQFHAKYKIPGKQVVLHLKRERHDSGLDIVSAKSFLADLFL